MTLVDKLYRFLIFENTVKIGLFLCTIIYSLLFSVQPIFAEANLVGSYDFNNNLTDTLGVTTLSTLPTNTTSGYGTDVGASDPSFWYWTSTPNTNGGGGFSIDIPQNSFSSSDYSIGLRFAFNVLNSGYNKIIDYKNRTSDNGFYFYQNKIMFYPGSGSGTKTINPGDVLDMVVTRNGTTKLFTVYFVVNGVLTKEFEYTDTSNYAVGYTTPDNKVRFGFFHDDLVQSSETTTNGKVYSVKLWNGAIGSSAVSEAMNPKFLVTFDDNIDGASVTMPSVQEVENGGKVTQPTNPTRTNFTFGGWYTTSGLTTPWNFSSDTVSQNTTLYAKWTANSYILTYTAGSNGSIGGTSPQTVGGGSSGSPVTAAPNTNYHFVNWSDNSTNNPRTDINVTQNIGVTANFAINTYTITYTAGSHGSISGASSQTINYGSDSSSVTAVADSGYHFTNWSDNSTLNPRQIIGVTDNYSLTANFAANDTDAPVISSVGATVTDTQSTITWVTNEPSSSRVQYGLNQNYGFITNETDTSFRLTNHSVILSSLKSCARYFYRVISTDATNNQSASNQKTFNTSGCAASTITTGTETTLPVTGGTVQLTNSLSTAQLNVPNNYASEVATFQINKLDTSQAPSAPSGKSIATNNFYDLIAVTETNDQINTFDNTVTFTVTYGSDTETDYVESTLDVYKYDGSQWIKKNCTLDTAANTLTCSLSGFSTYAVLGDAVVSSSSSNNSSIPNSSGSTACNNSPPVLTPDLFQINTTTTTAKLFFTPIDYNQYYISFSTNPDAEMHGESVTLTREGVQSETIYFLKPNTTYYFKVRGQNGCMPGPWSNIIQIKTDSRKYYKNNVFVNKKTTKVISPNISIPNVSPIITGSPRPTSVSAKNISTSVAKKSCFLWWCW